MTAKKPAIRTSLAPRKTDARDDLIPSAPAAKKAPATKAPAAKAPASKSTTKPMAAKADPITKPPARRVTVQLNSRVELDVADLVDEAVASGQFATKQAAIEHAIRTTFGG